MTNIIRGKVIKFLEGNDYKIVANIGVNSEVTVGMPFIVYYEGAEVIDPETNEDLGKLEYVKAKVKVSQVAEKYCILESDEITVTKPSMLESMMLSQRALHGTRAKKPLKLARGKDKEDVSKIEEEIIIGDLVRSDLSR